MVLRAREPERGKWDLPGGFREYGESPDETAPRETEEESGYAIEIVQLLGAWPDEYVELDGSLWPTINLIYQARIAEGSTSTGNVTAARWIMCAGHILTTHPMTWHFQANSLAR